MPKHIGQLVHSSLSGIRFTTLSLEPIPRALLHEVARHAKHPDHTKFRRMLAGVTPEQRANAIFMARVLDFRLWEHPGNWRHKGLQGYFGLLHRAADLWSSAGSHASFEQFSSMISPREAEPLARVRYRQYRKAIRFLSSYGGDFYRYLVAHRNPYGFCMGLVELEKFRDYYHGSYFLKPNQLLYYELVVGLGMEQSYHKKLTELTVFADYKLPHVLAQRGVLRLGQKLSQALAGRRVLPQYSRAVIELRTASVIVGKLLALQLGIPEYVVDNALWNMSHDATMPNTYFRVKSLYY